MPQLPPTTRRCPGFVRSARAKLLADRADPFQELPVRQCAYLRAVSQCNVWTSPWSPRIRSLEWQRGLLGLRAHAALETSIGRCIPCQLACKRQCV
eukprot:6191608-Pleurochrysis_carterae.AAC.4